jgi:SNF2 family DNA or RNA helicase
MRRYEDLHSYQQSAVDFIYNHDRSMALMPVGSGKSATAWTAMAELMDAGEVERPIVFAPMRVAQLVWAQERDQWEHLQGRPIVLWGGEPASWQDSLWKTSRQLWGSRQYLESRIPKIVDVRKRREAETKLAQIVSEERHVNKDIRRAVPPKAVHVISYENLSWLCELYTPSESPFDMWVFDELGKLKNPKSPRYKAVRKHTKEAKIVVGLNATPAPEGLLDLYAQVTVVDGGKLWGKSFYKWRDRYFVPSDWMGFNFRPQLGAPDLILKDLNTLAFRVDETDLAYQKTMQHSQIEVELPPKARAAYDDMERKMAVELEGREDDLVAMSAAASSMKLRQITSGFIYDETGRAVVLHEEKMNALSDLIDSMGREPLLVVYEFAQDLEMIRKIWRDVPYLGQGLGAAKAQDYVDRWNKRELPVMALHYLSAGHGVNLQAGGSHLCFYNLPWALDGWVQTCGRIDRQGQKRLCYSHSIVAKNSMDQRVWAALTAKDAAQQSVIAAVRKL